MPNILPTTPNQNLTDLKNTISWFSNQWGKFINTKVGRKVNRFFNGPTEYEYLMNTNELGANALELGVREGLTFGQKYPGVLEANKVFKRLEQNPSKGFVMQAIDWKNQPRRAWRAITGTLFGTTPFIFIQNQDQNKNESNIQ